MINVGNSIILVLVAAAVTFLLRYIPFAIFGGKREMPKGVKKVADILPAAIMSVLVIYCVKSDIVSLQTFVMQRNGEGLVSLLATIVALSGVIFIHLKRRQTLLSIATGTVIYMALIRILPIIL